MPFNKGWIKNLNLLAKVYSIALYSIKKLITDIEKGINTVKLVHTQVVYLGGDGGGVESLQPDAVPRLERLAQQPCSLFLVLCNVRLSAPQLSPDLRGSGDSGVQPRQTKHQPVVLGSCRPLVRRCHCCQSGHLRGGATEE